MNAVTNGWENALLDALLFLQMFVDARAKFISRWCWPNVSFKDKWWIYSNRKILCSYILLNAKLAHKNHVEITALMPGITWSNSARAQLPLIPPLRNTCPIFPRNFLYTESNQSLIINLQISRKIILPQGLWVHCSHSATPFMIRCGLHL